MKDTDYIGSLAKGLKVLEAFDRSEPRLTIADVARLTNLDRATSRRCLLTFHALGYAHYDGKFFSLTSKVFNLGRSHMELNPLPKIIQPWLDKLSKQIGHSTSASVLDGTEIVYIARASQQRIMSINLTIGSRLPAWCSSMGRVLLAGLSQEERNVILQRSQIIAQTPKTCINRTDLDEIFKNIKRQGYAFIDQELELGLCSIAVPLKNKTGKTIAAINLGMPAAQIEVRDIFEKYLPLLKDCSHNISEYINE